ncbi:apolipoprotein N-acyltransferase [Actinomycetaceae bacterium MB13-C1-2]|nr:apolipoprotein N-acyltransferase [Actinomycetaceae bacterium MB13-C1-2]
MSSVLGKSESKRGFRATGSLPLDLLLLVISAVAMWASFPALSIWPLMIPSLALLVFVIDRVGPLRAGLYAVFWAMVFLMPHISWMQIATDGTILAWIALAGAQAFFIGLWGSSFSALGTWRWSRTVWGEVLGGALLWVTFEELRSRVPFGGFPWGKLAYPQVDSPMIIYAPVGGEVLVSFLVMAAAILLRRALALREPLAPSPWGRLGALGVAALIAFGPVFFRLPNTQQEGSVSIAAVQGNVEVPASETFSVPGKVTGNHLAETLRLLESEPRPQIVFWGENSTDLDPRYFGETKGIVEKASDAAEVPLVIGIMERDGDVRYNWVGVWYPKEGSHEAGFAAETLYGKQRPVPWGEYIPFRALTLKLATAAAQIQVDMVPVDNPGYMEVELNDGSILPIAVGICFEVAYEPIIAEGVRMGGQLIYIPTNNVHFDDSAESLQQLQMLQFRAAEFSRSAVQVSTNGASGIARPDGSLLASTPMQVAAHLQAEVPLRSTITLAARLGESLSWVVIFGGGALALASVGAHIYGRSLVKAQKNQVKRKETAKTKLNLAKSNQKGSAARGKRSASSAKK